jgi:Helix-turn-helix
MREDAAKLRSEVRALLDKVTDRGSLLYFSWLVQLIAKDEKLPPPEVLKKLHGVFIRVTAAFRTRRKISADDWEMMFKYVGVLGNDLDVSRPLASTAKFYREKAGLTRLQLAKKLKLPVRLILKLERGGIKDLSLPRLYQLADALNVDAGEFMDRMYKLKI